MQDNSGNPLQRIGIANLIDKRAAGDLSSAFLGAHADEGTVWLVNSAGDALVASHNSGPDAERIVGFVQPLGSGLISMVFETEQSFCENEVRRNADQDRRLDRHLGKSTRSLIAVPFVILGETCGVISCVQLEGGVSRETGFTGKDLDRVARAAEAFQQAIERALAGHRR